jgi:hypothetical protein
LHYEKWRETTNFSLFSFDVWLNLVLQIPDEYPLLSVGITKEETKKILLLYSKYFMETKQNYMFNKSLLLMSS